MADDNLIDVLTKRRPAGERDVPREEPDDSLLPDPTKGPEPFSRAANKPLYTVHFILGAEGYRSFQYIHIDVCTLSLDQSGHVIRLRFCGLKIHEVTIRGRNLWKLYDYLGQHRISYVARVDRGRDFGADDEPAVTDIDIVEVKEQEEGQPQ